MRNDCDFLSDTINKMKIGERKMKIGKIISEEIKKLIGKLTFKIQKVILNIQQIYLKKSGNKYVKK